MRVKFVNFPKQYHAHKEEYDEVISKCLEGGKYILQDELEAFEHEFATFLGMNYVVGVGSGTDALLLALKALEVDALLTVPGYTFKATMEAVYHSDADLVVGDIGENRLLPETEAPSLPVHIEGMVNKQPNAYLEDACQAVGAEGVGYSGTACFSFYPAKILGGFGDGGAVATNDAKVAGKIRLLRHHWQTDKYEHHGYCSRLDNVQASFLRVKLKYLPEILARRAEIAERYKELEGVGDVKLPTYQKGRVWQDYVIRVENPEKLAEYMKEKGVETLGVGLTPPHKSLRYSTRAPETESLYKEMLRLPCNETLENGNVERVIEVIKNYYG